MFYFQGVSTAAYYEESGWTELDGEFCDHIGTYPCVVGHNTITTPAALASALVAASGATIQAKLANIGATVIATRPTVGP
ncbi:hypothetical protein MKQ70_32010 [Chitinophaga sedimenti]|uniref:hypothetical protein n=1 Tax=Chitinophaga sedimenti TaxID=2033606 RepID=UPI002002AAF3|nr:hypothetical protein [Chitinophaga sedimenti]MCK7559343.1 hypothetical protein [Chitinophaga sedimenti]